MVSYSGLKIDSHSKTIPVKAMEAQKLDRIIGTSKLTCLLWARCSIAEQGAVTSQTSLMPFAETPGAIQRLT